MSDNWESVSEALPKEIKRVREEKLPIHDGTYGRMIIRHLQSAEKAIDDGDLPGMLNAYLFLKEI